MKKQRFISRAAAFAANGYSRIPRLMVLPVLVALSAQAVDCPYAFSLRRMGAQPAVLDGLSSPEYSADYRGATTKGGLTVNPETDAVYASSYVGDCNRVYRFDPDSEGPADSPIESSIGLVEKGVFTTDYGFYRGSVLGGTHETVHNNMRVVFVTFNPLIATGNHTNGAFVTLETAHSRWFGEFIAQSVSEELGEMNEGSLGSPVVTAARVSCGYINDSTYTFGSNNGLSGWLSFIAFDLHRGVFTPANDTVGGIPIHRYFVGMCRNEHQDFAGIALMHAKETRESEPTVDSVSQANRYAYLRDRDVSKDGKAVLVSTNAFEQLVPDVSGDLGYGLAQDPHTGHLYILTGTETESYLCAIAPNIDDDSDVLPTFDVVDLDLGSDKTYLTLSDLHEDLTLSGGLALNGDASTAPTRLYVGALSAIYALDLGPAVPPPSPSTIVMFK